MPQPCHSTDADTDATLVSVDTADVIDVIRLQADQLGHYNSRCLIFAITDLCKLFLQYPQIQDKLIAHTEEAFFNTLDDMYSAGITDYESDNKNP